MYIARDKDGGLFLFKGHPWRQQIDNMWLDAPYYLDYKYEGNGCLDQLNPDLFKDLTWDNEPIEVIRVKDIVKVIGRGYVIVTEPGNVDVHVDDLIKVRDEDTWQTFSVRGVESVSWMKTIGIVTLRSEDLNKMCKVGDYVEVINCHDRTV